MKPFIYGLIILLFLHQNAQSASFDCSKASTKIENLLCADPILSNLDSQLGTSFSALKKQLKKSEFRILLRNQRKWLKSRKWCFTLKDIKGCLQSKYNYRLEKLNAISLDMFPPLKQIEELCSRYKKRTLTDDYDYFDINNDGIKEKIHWNWNTGLDILMSIKYETTDGDIGLIMSNEHLGEESLYDDYDNHSVRFFKHENHIYSEHTYHKEGSRRIQYSTPENKIYDICGFKGHTTNTFSSPTQNPDHNIICKTAKENGLKYVQFDEDIKLNPDIVIPAPSVPQKKHYLDINNDGKDELIAEIGFYAASGRACDSIYYRELSDDGSDFKVKKYSILKKSPILKLQGLNWPHIYPKCGGYNNRFFEFSGKVYFESNNPGNLRSISILEDGKVSNICLEKNITKYTP